MPFDYIFRLLYPQLRKTVIYLYTCIHTDARDTRASIYIYVNIETCNHNYIIILIVLYDNYFTMLSYTVTSRVPSSSDLNASLPIEQLSGPAANVPTIYR